MSTYLNTLFVTTDGAWVHKEHETIVVEVDGERRLQVPLLHIASIVCLARANVSPELMSAATEAGIHVAFFSQTGRFFARVEGLPGGNVLLRRAQHRAADDEARTLAIARAIVAGKLANQRRFLLNARRDLDDGDRAARLEATTDRMLLHLQALGAAKTPDEVRGVEGIGAREYFEVLGLLIKKNDEAFAIQGRSRRPPRDRLNAMLSFGYVLLMQDCVAAAAGVGLDPAVGYLHEDRPGRLSLGLDLMEELRAPVVDRLCLAMVNRSQMAPEDFTGEPAGGWRMTDDARKRFLVAYQEAKQAPVTHPFLDQSIPWGAIPHLQARLLARTLRGDLDAYPPFTIR